LRLTIEAVTGKQYSGLIDADLVRITDISDLSLSLRRDLSPEECLERLARTVTTKASFVGAGPALDDLDGYGEAKAWGMELAADMADFRAGRIAWDDVDHKGLLLSGPPGTGKTTFAQALAKSAGVPLVATSVAQWNASTYLSGTLQSIASVFAEAKRVAPSILFIDELDGISNRQNIREYAEYWVQIVNTLLELLAGIGDRMGVVVVAATNHPEKIDPAILRAGRLDHHIRLQKPDLDALTRIFRYHLGQDALPGEDLMQLALAAFGGTGADVEAWVRRAKATARRERREMGTHDVLSQILAQAPAIPPELRHRVAIHEAGHVVFGRASGIADLVGVSILRDGGATEVTGLSAIGATEERLQAALGFLLAGRAAEELVLGSASVGSGGTHAQSDLAQATRLAVMAETHYGYGQALGLVHLAGEHLDNLHLHPELLQAVKERLDRGFNYSTETLANHINEVVAIGAALDEAGYLSKTDVERIVHAAKAEDPLAVTGSAKLAQVTK
jgi:ATP-dependent Zn protease